MEFMNGLFGAAGCNPDGTMGQNAFTGLIDRTMESQFFVDSNMGSLSDMTPMSFMEMPIQGMQPQAPMMNAIHQSRTSYPGVLPLSMPTIPMPIPMMMPPAPLMMMPQQRSFLNTHHHTRSRGPDHEIYDDYQTMDHHDANDEYRVTDADDDTDQAMLERLMNENDFINGTTIVVDDYDDHDQLEPSRDGYQNAWHKLEEKLEHGQLSSMDIPHTVTSDGRVYAFQQNNHQLSQQTTYSNKNLEELFEQGMEHYREGRIQIAIQSFEAVVQQADENGTVNIAECWRMLGLCHTENDEDKAAIVCFIKAVDDDPYHLDALLSLGTCYMNELDSFKALETLKAWVTHNPRFGGLEVPQDEYSDGSLMDEVMQLMLAVAEYAPADPDVQVVLGVLYNISGDYPNAVECFRKALMQNPNSFNYLNKLAATLANGGRSEEALPFYAKALQNRPNFARAWMNLGISYSNLNLFDAASKAYVQALHLSPSAKHIWGYLRVVLNSMERSDLVELSASENVDQLANELKVDLIQKR